MEDPEDSSDLNGINDEVNMKKQLFFHHVVYTLKSVPVNFYGMKL